MPQPLTVGSLFAGIGGFDLGLERAGAVVRWQIEREPFCKRVLSRHWPNVRQHDDVTTAHEADLEPVDVLCGGFPCQDVSVAGKRAGLAGARSGLFFTFADVADALRPEWLILENVPGLLTSHGGRDFYTVLATLAERGWRRAYRILDSRYFGVAQRRRRVFVVCHRGTGRGRAETVLFESTSGSGDSETRETTRARVARGTTDGPGFALRADPGGTGQAHNTNYLAFDWQSGGDVRHNVADRSSSLQANQTPAVYQCHGTNVGPMGTLRAGNGNETGGVPFIAHALTSSMHKPHDEDTDTLIAHSLSTQHGVTEDGTGRGVPVIAATLNSGGNDGGFRTEPGEHLLATFDERNVTSPDNRSSVEPGKTCHTLHESPPALIGAGVRRLTPLECERLQGFPDGWTCLCGVTPYSTRACKCPDSPRYRALGNAVTVSVAEFIGRQLLQAIHSERVA